MKNQKLVITALMFMFANGIYFRNVYDGSIRTIEFISIFSIGFLFALLIERAIQSRKNKLQG